jgi:hypothetical protein
MKRVVLIVLFLTSCSVLSQAQSEPTAQNDKAEQVVRRAIERMGGNRYLNVRTAVSRGIYSQYKDGSAQLGSSFADYIVYPDKERTEFKTQGVKSVQTNVGDKGWLFDGMARTLKDMTEEQINDFRNYTLRTSVESLLRGFWKKDGATLNYIGRREASLGRRNEVVQLKYPDGFTVEFEFSSDGLPAKVVYKRKVEVEEEKPEETADESKKTSDSAKEDDGFVKEEVRLAQFVEIDGVFTPYIIDTYRAGKQTARVNFQSVEFNKEVPESLFAKPASVKDVK